ncbi:MAG: glycosyltransferase family 39 protein [Candidatus Alcyoniella australis]|nr:glycosyltransferase family 39 protein [Candidatus Alcyoniella australis]
MSRAESAPQAVRALHLALVAALLLVTLGAHVALHRAPPYLDTWDHATVSRILLRGGEIYSDAFDETGPGIYWITSGAMALFGDRIAVLLYAATCAVLLNIVLLFAAGVRLGRPNIGLLSALIYALYHPLIQGTAWQSESIITPMMLAAFVLLQSSSRMRTAAVWAGLALFIATLTKQTAWIATIALVALLTVRALRSRERGASQQLLGIGLGLCLPWLLVLGTSLARGTLGTFLDGYLFPLLHYGTAYYVSLATDWHFWLSLPLWWMVLSSLLLLRGRTLPGLDRSLLLTFLAAAVLMALPALFPYHHLPFLTFASLGFCLAIFPPASNRRRLTLVAGMVACVCIAVWLVPRDALLNELVPRGEDLRGQVVKRVRELTQPHDTIAAIPYDSYYYYQSERMPPGRHTFLLPWTTPPFVLDEFLNDYDAHPPQAIVYTFYQVCNTNRVLPKQYLAPLLELISEQYRIDSVYQNGAVLLTPNNGEPDMRVRALLFSDVQCLDLGPEVHAGEFTLDLVLR